MLLSVQFGFNVPVRWAQKLEFFTSWDVEKNWRKVRSYNLFKSICVGCFHMFYSLYFAQQRKFFCLAWYVFAVNYTAIVLSNDCFVRIAYSLRQLLRNKLHNPICQHSAILVFSIVIFSTCSKLKKPSLFFWGRFICNMTHVAVAFGCFFFLLLL